MLTLPQAAAFGFVGGVARAAVGILKAMRKRERFSLPRLIAILVLSGFIGMFAAMVFVSEAWFVLLAGYAGTDFIEGIWKAMRRGK